VIHQDIKLENILIDEYFNLKLTDFTVSLKLQKNIKDFQFAGHGTNCYMSPENIRKERVEIRDCYKNDYFGLGVMMYKLAFKTYPFNVDPKKDGKDEIYRKLTKEKLTIPNNSHLTKDCVDLIKNLLEQNYRKRYDLKDLLENNWVKQGKTLIEEKENYSDTNKFILDLINDNLVT